MNATKTTTTVGITNQQCKRRDRSVSPATAKKTNSLKSYNATYPRGKASYGSVWSINIYNALKS